MAARNTGWRYCLQDCQNSVRNYTVNLIVMFTFHGMIWPFLSIGVTSIEKRYSLSSTQSGLIFSAAEIGRIPMLVLVSHFGNRYSIPKILALSGIGIALSELVMSLPHFIFSPATLATTSDSHLRYCMDNSSNDSTVQNSTEVTAAGNTQAYGMIVAGMVMLGICASPLMSLAITYIDNNAKEGSAPIYIGLVNSSFPIGSILATFLGAYFISINVDLSATTLTPADPAWVGAWWLMMLTCSVTVLCTSPFMACYPRSINKKPQLSNSTELSEYENLTNNPDNIEKSDLGRNNQAVPVDSNMKASYTLKNLPVSIFRIVTNPIFLTITINNVLRDIATFGIVAYQPKYLENMFHITAWLASTYSGMGNVASGAGLFLSSILMTKLRLSYLSTIKLIVIASVGVIVANIGQMFMGCESTMVIGDIYSDGRSLSLAPCADECVCSLEVYSPLCDVGTNITYFSPCHAGCPVPTAGNITQPLSSCHCASVGEVLELGSCTKCPTEKLVIYLIFSYLSIFCFAMCLTPCASLLFRCVLPKDKGLMMGLSILFASLLAWMPCAVIYGRVIDMTCSLWQTVGDSRGACWLYDHDRLRLSVFGLSVALHNLALFVLIGTWFIASKRRLTWTTMTEKD